MAESLRVGVIGLTHDHAWGNLADLQDSTLGSLVAAADPNQPLLDKVATVSDCERTYLSPEDMLAKEDLDAVYVFGDNKTGSEWATQALSEGIPVLVEKPMAATLQGADTMLAASRMGGTPLVINWPFAWWPQMQHAYALVEEGKLGRVFSTKYRSAHNGPKALGCTPYFYGWLYDNELNGAGALMDYCCYGAAMASSMMGLPARVTGVMNRCVHEFVAQEDNAIIVMSYGSGMSTTEASWSQIGHLTSYTGTFYGTEATVVIHNDGRLQMADAEHDDGIDLDVPAAPPHWISATACFLNHLVSGTPIMPLCSARVGRDAQEILEAGIISGHSGRAVSLPLPLQQ